MSNHYTTTDLVNSLKRRISIPTSQATYTDQELVDFLNDEFEGTIVPLISSIREDFFISSTDFTVTNSTSSFAIPSNAVGQRLRDIVLVDNAGGNEHLTNLPRLSLEQISSVSGIGVSGFYLEGNTVKLYPVEGWDDTLRMYYFKRPNKLVLVNKTGKISSIAGDVVTLESVPSSWTTATIVNVITPDQPFSATENLTISLISGNDVTLSSTTGLAAGDYVAVQGESPIAQMPSEANQLLMQAVKVEVSDAMGDEEMIISAKAKYKQLQIHLMKALTPRVDGQVKKVVSRNNVFSQGLNRGHY